MTKANVTILTSGETGSSVLTGLIARAGFWPGDETFRKSEYDTYENSELVTLDQELIKRSGFTGNYMYEFSQEAIDRIASIWSGMDDAPYRRFVNGCQAHRPWIWKDPRLWLTIRAWAPLLDLGGCKFVVLTRRIKDCWVAGTLRRHILSYNYLKRKEESIQNSALDFLKSNMLSHLHVTYENLVAQPGRTLSELNSYLNIRLTVDDLQAIYRGPLYQIPRKSRIDFLRAVLIYIKNYSERADVAAQGNRKPAS
jgi:hypothetical protein